MVEAPWVDLDSFISLIYILSLDLGFVRFYRYGFLGRERFGFIWEGTQTAREISWQGKDFLRARSFLSDFASGPGRPTIDSHAARDDLFPPHPPRVL